MDRNQAKEFYPILQAFPRSDASRNAFGIYQGHGRLSHVLHYRDGMLRHHLPGYRFPEDRS